MKVGILGAGNWGTTLAMLVANTHAPVQIWCRNEAIQDEINTQHTNRRYVPGVLPSAIHASTDLLQVVASSELLFVVLPTNVFRKIAFEVGKVLKGDQIVVSASKGMEVGRGNVPSSKTMSDVFQEETCCKKIGVLSGPNIALDILRGDPSGTVIASHYEEVIDQVISVLQQPKFKVYANRDLKGVEIAGALKNTIAIAAGIAHGLGLQQNAKAFLLTRGIAEMSRLGQFLGAQPETFYGMAGIGDLIATCFSENSRNNRFGRALAAGKKPKDIFDEIQMVVEGVHTTSAVYELSQKFNIFMPITQAMYRILYENALPQEEIKTLMQARIKYEGEERDLRYSDQTHALIHKYPIPEYLL